MTEREREGRMVGFRVPSHPIYDVGVGRKVRQGRMWGRLGETG